MDYTKCFKKVLLNYPFIDPVVELIRHNENITYKVIDEASEDTYLLRMHKPITKNMEGVHNTREGIQSELKHLLAWSSYSKLPAQTPVPNLNGELVTTIVNESEDVHCSVLTWIDGDTMSKEDFTSEEMVSALGKRIASLHQFSQKYQHKHVSNFIRPEYEIEWANNILVKLRSGTEKGIITTKDFEIIENTFSLIIDCLKVLDKTTETWGFIHADINFSNLILTSSGISFIDFGLSGFGYYLFDVAMGSLILRPELRNTFLEAYNLGKENIKYLEGFMLLAFLANGAFHINNKSLEEKIKENIPKLCSNYFMPFLKGEIIFYKIVS